ncbi:SusC/RagA family TonB-linked outer membrane protein [Pedobacter sp. P351]|uniref:SusC/RagA family TonB-linked outer membrane protein n=1 Tax=Pedobacter superstes TaxID=3133441 RepID=UPI00309EF3D7
MHIFKKAERVILFAGLCFSVSFSTFAQQNDSLTNGQADSVSAPVAASRNTGPKAVLTIVDATSKKPLSGINVSVEGYSGAITDENGKASISVPDFDAVLRISATVYQNKEVPLRGESTLTIKLYESGYNSVYSLVTLPSGSISQSRIPYAVSSVRAREMWGESIKETPDTYLQGKVAGLNVVRRSGTPSIGANMFLRGFNSLYTSNQPLIVVDGMIYNNETLANSLFLGNSSNALENIDVKDIEDITIIKDAGAAVYGTKGGNGVMLITTRRPVMESTQIDFSSFGGYNSSANRLPVLDASNYRIYLTSILQSQGMSNATIAAQPYMASSSVGNSDFFKYQNGPNNLVNTDWQKEAISSSYSQNYHLNVAGGDNIAKYNLSLGYLNNEGIIKNTNLSRYFTRFNADFRLTPKLRAVSNLSFTNSVHNIRNQGLGSNTSPVYLSLIKSPFTRTNAVGALGGTSPVFADSDIFSVSNPASLIEDMVGINTAYRVSAAANFIYQFNPKFSVQSLLGVTYDKVRERMFIPSVGIAQDTLGTAVIDNRIGTNTDRMFAVYSDTKGTYSFLSKDHQHSVYANLGMRFKDDRYESDYGLTYNSATDDYTSLGSGNPNLRNGGGSLSNMRWLSTYTSVDYSFKNKYFASFNAAIDGSSRFGKDIPDVLTFNGNKFAMMPSVAAAWLVSSEEFFKPVDFINFLKFRASYGLTGNDDIGNYAALPYYVGQSLYGLKGYIRGNVGNTQLKWETIEKLNGGVDVSLFDERFKVSFDIYSNNTRDMLTYDDVPSASGFDLSVSNSGSMRTNGIDLSIDTRLINRQLKWDMGITLGHYKNKVTSLSGGRIISDGDYLAGAAILTEVGRSSNLFYGYLTNGVYSTSAEAEDSGLTNRMSDGMLVGLQGGDVRFADTNGDKFVDEEDRVVIGDPNPDFTGMFRNSLNFKNWSFDAIFTFSSGNDVYNGTRASLESMGGYENQIVSVNSRWKAEGQITNMPRAAFGDPAQNSRFSDRWIEDGSYLRLRTVGLSYNLPLKEKFFKTLKLYANGHNLVSFTKYLGYDPEFSSSRSVFSQGVDTGLEPQFRTIQFGVRLGI